MTSSIPHPKPLSDSICAGSGQWVSKPVGQQYTLVDCPSCPRSFERRHPGRADTAWVPQHYAPITADSEEDDHG